MPRRLLGLLAALPAFIALLWSYAWPTIWTLHASFSMGSGLSQRGGSPSRNYGGLGAVAGSFGYSLLVAVVPLVAVLVIGPLAGWATARAARGARLAVRVVLALAMTPVATIAVAASWLIDRRFDPGSGVFDASWPVWIMTLGLAVALSTTAYLSAFRSGGRRVLAVLTVAIIGACAVLAMSLQTFTVSYFTSSHTQSPLLLITRLSFVLLETGRATAADVVLLAVLAILGIVATLAAVVSGARIALETPAERTARRSASPVATVVAILAAALTLAVLVYAIWPWLSQLAHGDILMRSPSSAGALGVLTRTWLPPLLPALVGCVLAALAGFGIGALRPLGRYSEALLLVFAPWLFVGLGPLLPHAVSSRVGHGSHALDAIPPVWLSIPTLMIVTLFFRGRQAWLRAAGAGAPSASGASPSGPHVRSEPGVGAHVAAVAPIVALAFLITWIGLAQNTIWWYAVDYGQHPSAVGGLLASLGQYISSPKHAGVGLASPPPVLLIAALALIAVQVFVFERLTIGAGRMPVNPAMLGSAAATPGAAGWPAAGWNVADTAPVAPPRTIPAPASGAESEAIAIVPKLAGPAD